MATVNAVLGSQIPIMPDAVQRQCMAECEDGGATWYCTLEKGHRILRHPLSDVHIATYDDEGVTIIGVAWQVMPAAGEGKGGPDGH